MPAAAQIPDAKTLLGDLGFSGDQIDQVMSGQAGITATQTENVALSIKIDPTGAADSIKVHDAMSAEAGERVAAVARDLAPFEPPGDSIAQCVADHPFFVWIQLRGDTRPPIRVR